MNSLCNKIINFKHIIIKFKLYSIRKISILIYHRDKYPKTRVHLIWNIVDIWKKMDLEVNIIKGVPHSADHCDLLLPHIDLTSVPRKYIRFTDNYTAVLNRKLTDISKRRISNNLLNETSEFDGPVIVKTNMNFGGMPEYKMRGVGKKITDRINRIFDPGEISKMISRDYPVFNSKADVPPPIWKNPHLVVERFIPEVDDKYFCIRVCFLLGDVTLNTKLYSRSKVIKGGNIEYAEPTETPVEIMEIQKELGLDYGKLDYVIHEGAIHILDVNKTPGLVDSEEINKRIAEKLSHGIFKYLNLS